MENLKVRIGTPEDVDVIMALALSACEENGFLEPDPTCLLSEIWPALNRDHGLIGIINAANGEAMGAILLRIGKMWYSARPVLEEKAIFINPTYRCA